MEGQNLTLQCGSKLKSGEKSAGYYWFWVVKDRSLGKKKLPQLDLLQKHGTKITKIKPFGFTSTPELVPGTLSDMKLINVNRYAPGKYLCAVATVLSDRSNYVEVTYQNVVVKSKDLRC